MDPMRRRRDWPAERRRSYDDPFGAMFQDLQHLADNMMSAAGRRGVDYPLNLFETDEAFVLELAVPGMEADDIDLQMDGRDVTIHARMAEEDEGGRRYYVRGISQEEIRQHLRLPGNIDSESVSATVRNGLLTITFPKARQSRPRRISVEDGAGGSVEVEARDSDSG